MATTKDRVHQLADQLPPEATLEDAIERLVFEAKIDRGLAQAAELAFRSSPA